MVGVLLIVIIFMLVLLGSVAKGLLPLGLVWLYLALSIITFLVYAWDKSAAIAQRWRTKESTLHLLAIGGGWPGAYAAQRLLRHKSVKASFKRMFWLSVVVNLAFFVWLFSLHGAEFLANLSLLLSNILA